LNPVFLCARHGTQRSELSVSLMARDGMMIAQAKLPLASAARATATLQHRIHT